MALRSMLRAACLFFGPLAMNWGFVGSQLQLLADDAAAPATSPNAVQNAVRWLETVISGQVLDADTGQPIKSFQIIPSTIGSGPILDWDRRNPLRGIDGKYSVTCLTRGGPHETCGVRIEAAGYVPAESPPFRSNERSVNYDFKLEKGRAISGIVRLPNGQPAEGAEVGLATNSATLSILNGRRQQDGSRFWTKADKQGRFSLPADAKPYDIVALNDQGVRRISGESLNDNEPIVLEPWARIEGQLFIGDRSAGPGEEVVFISKLDEEALYVVSFINKTKTGPEGRFAFDRVASGEGTVYRSIPMTFAGRTSGQCAHGNSVQTNPGETAIADIRDTERAAVGRLIFPEGSGEVAWNSAHVQVWRKEAVIPWPEDIDEGNTAARKKWKEQWLQTPEGKAYDELMTKPAIPWPKDIPESDFNAREEWRKKWMKTPEGKEYVEANKRKNIRLMSACMTSNGIFRIEDVPPDTYQATVQLLERIPNSCGANLVGTAVFDFTMPPYTISESADPLDLGPIQVEMARRVDVGSVAPDFEVQTLSGESLRLSDLRGKYVLVDFWATWCGPCVAEMPHLSKIYDQFKSNDRFIMVGLSCDTEEADFHSFVSEKKLAWPQAMLKTGSQVRQDYGASAIPALFLIDPDGKIAAKGLRGPAIAQELERVLK